MLMTDECNYDQPLVHHQSVGLQKCWMKPVLELAPSQPTAHCFAPCILKYCTRSQSFEQKRECLHSKRRTTSYHAQTEEQPATMYTLKNMQLPCTHRGCKSHFHVILGSCISSNQFGADLRVCFHWRWQLGKIQSFFLKQCWFICRMFTYFEL